MRAPIHSNKHYVQTTLSTVLAGAALDITIATAEQAVDRTVATEIAVGAVIKAVYIEMWIRAGDTSPGSTLVTFYKGTAGQGLAFAEQAALHGYNQKKDVFYHTQGLTNDQDADAIPFIRQWFKIPKSKQRFGLGDTLRLSIAAQALDNIVCGFMTYKEYN